MSARSYKRTAFDLLPDFTGVRAPETFNSECLPTAIKAEETLAPIEQVTERIDRNTRQITDLVHYMSGMRTKHVLGACALNAAQKAQRNMIRYTEELRMHGFFTLEELAETTPYHFELEMA